MQFLKAFYAAGLGTVFFVILLHNISQLVLAAAYNRMYGWSNLLHPAVHGLAGLAILQGTYPLMRDAPLEPKPRKG